MRSLDASNSIRGVWEMLQDENVTLQWKIIDVLMWFICFTINWNDALSVYDPHTGDSTGVAMT